MLALITPSKRLNDTPAPAGPEPTQPELLEESAKLVKKLQGLSVPKLMDLMSISEDLAKLNRERYQNWAPPFTTNNASPAVLSFQGDVYMGLKAESFTRAQLKYAQKHLRILSGLYGVLRPLDLMQPYRLEMGTSLSVGRNKHLYEFWGEQITNAVNGALADSGNPILVNLASNEYYKAIQPKAIEGEIIKPSFKEEKNGRIRVVTIFAKQARGMMANHIVTEKVKDIEGLKEFQQAGYQFDESLSKKNELVFVRPQPAPVNG